MTGFFFLDLPWVKFYLDDIAWQDQRKEALGVRDDYGVFLAAEGSREDCSSKILVRCVRIPIFLIYVI